MNSNQSTRPGASRRNAWSIVALREMMVKLTDKAFVLGTLSTVLLVVGGAALSGWLSSRTETMTIAVTDDASAQLATTVGEVSRAADDKLLTEVKRVSDAAAGEALVRDGGADALLTKDAQGRWQLVFKQGSNRTLVQGTSQVLTQQAMSTTAQKAGTTMDAVMAEAQVGTRSLVGDEKGEMMGFVVGAVFSVLFLMSAMTYGMQIAQSVVEEKQSRIIEILTAAIPVRQLLAGKVIGNTVLALGQMLLLAVAGFGAAKASGIADKVPSLGGAVAWYLLFFVAGFLALACIWAMAGSMCTRNEDLQQTSQPLIWVLILAYMAAFLAEGTIRSVLSYVPIVSSILMPARIVEGTAQWYDLVGALALNLLFAFVTVLLGERVYRRALLQTQGRLSYREALKLAR